MVVGREEEGTEVVYIIHVCVALGREVCEDT